MLILLTLVSGFLFAQDIKLDSSFGYRQQIDHDAKLGETRVQSLIKGRLGGSVDLMDTVKGVAQITTTGTGTTSSYENLGSGFMDKGISLRLAYVDWNPYDNIHISLGKMENPFYVAADAELLWDNDLSFDGLATSYSYDTEAMSIYGVASAFLVNENGFATTDEYLLGLQAGFKYDFGMFNMHLGMSYYDYTGRVENNKPDMNLLEAYGVFGFDAGIPVIGYMDYTYDSARPTSHTANEAFVMGVNVGELKEVWDIAGIFAWQKVKAIGANPNYLNSDFMNRVGSNTDINGWRFGVKTMITDNLTAGLSYYLSSDETVAKRDYNFHKILFDLKFDFDKIL